MRVCKIEECPEVHYGKGYCLPHYRKIVRDKEKQRIHYKNYVERNLEKVSEYGKIYRQSIEGGFYEKYKQSLSKGKKKHNQSFPERTNARNVARYHIDRENCEVEGCIGLGERHHDDYSKPLEIRFLCNKHHREHHDKKRKSTKNTKTCKYSQRV